MVFAATMNVRQVVSILVSYVTWHHQFSGRDLENNKTRWEMGEIMLEGWGGLMNLMERWTGVYRCCPLLVSSS